MYASRCSPHQAARAVSNKGFGRLISVGSLPREGAPCMVFCFWPVNQSVSSSSCTFCSRALCVGSSAFSASYSL